MKEEPYKDILDRHTCKVHLKEHFGDTLELTEEMVNYGSNLIPRSFGSSARKISDIAIIGGLLHHSVTMLDAISVLVSEGAVYSAFIQARSLFETRLYIEWIFKEDTTRRANQYFVWHRREELIWARRAVPGRPEYDKFRGACSDLLEGMESKLDVEELQAEIQRVMQILDDEEFRHINAEFDRLKSAKREHDVQWYKPWGPRSIFDMAKRLELEGEYLMFYSMFSKATHSNSFGRNVLIHDTVMNFEHIRHLKDISTLLNLSLAYSIAIYHKILIHYRPGELQNFRRKYVDEWQSRFTNIPNVKYSSSSSGSIS